MANKPFIIGVAGASAGGKTTMSRKVMEIIKNFDDNTRVILLSTDNYYHTLSRNQSSVAKRGEYNFDHPDALDFDLLAEHMNKLRNGEEVSIPSYDFITHRRTDNATALPTDVDIVILEGLFVLAVPEVLEVLNLKVFVKEDVDVCLMRRLRRDLAERNLPMETGLSQYEQYVKPAYENFIKPSAKQADLIVPNAGMNDIAIEVIAQWIRSQSCRFRGVSQTYDNPEL